VGDFRERSFGFNFGDEFSRSPPKDASGFAALDYHIWFLDLFDFLWRHFFLILKTFFSKAGF